MNELWLNPSFKRTESENVEIGERNIGHWQYKNKITVK